ncbi:DUF418 domain-containing protein [Metabacillus malikii]|uniref:DUF418 domain-containing protein n=1 Tax=Metabacillus malikii TaxID=1504265 RepID=A0ABT9ZJW0_9BACI|nr:DUF418 domain-containing protein [Metabacillus malikii]MDQ0232576.1 uncharacterized protein [Metabacillus malikii]
MSIQNRIHAIDGLRGLSLFGILMANMLIFQYGMWGKDDLDFFTLSQVEHIAYYLLKIFIEGSFMPIFAFLFGYSMVIMQKGLKKRGIKIKRTFFRRAIFLIIVGLLHSFFLWEGDILLLYGVMAIFLLLFLNRKPKTLLIWTIILLCLVPLSGYGGSNFETAAEKKSTEDYIQNTIEVYGNGSYFEIMDHRLNETPIDFPIYFVMFGLLLTPLLSATLFLLGIYCAKKEWFVTPNIEKKRYFLFAAFLIPVGLILKSIVYMLPESNWGMVFNIFGANLLSFGYICLFALMYIGTRRIMIVKMFESVGRLSFTNYISQTVICTTIFYGYGFGLFGELGVGLGIGLSLLIYMLQMVGSYWYLKCFRIGPLERLLRMFTNLTWNGAPKGKTSNNQTVSM